MRRALAALLFGCALPALAARIDVQLVDAAGQPLADAVAWAVPRGATAQPRPRPGTIEQFNRAFVPGVTVVQTGAAVRFPNRDPFRHHVYSFSAAKRFSLKLYVGEPPEPVVFDKPGLVVLGCNIHDQMLAYVLVVDTPHFGKSEADGRVRLDSLPAGDYELHAWHPRQAEPLAPVRLALAAESAATQRFSFGLAAATSPR